HVVVLLEFVEIGHEALEGAPPLDHVVGARRGRGDDEALAALDRDRFRATVLRLLRLVSFSRCGGHCTSPPRTMRPSSSSAYPAIPQNTLARSPLSPLVRAQP